jgi:hypothetical protein
MSEQQKVIVRVSRSWIQQLVARNEVVIDSLGRVQGFSQYLERMRQRLEGAPA